MTAVNHGHASLRFDADPEAVAAFLVELIEAESLSLLTTDESRSRALVRALRGQLPAGYRVVRRFEYLIIWHAPTYQAHPLAFLAALDPRAFAMLGGRRMFRVARKRFRHRETGTNLRAEVAHAPSGVDGGPGHWSTEHHDRVTIANHGFAAWGARIRRYRRRRPRGAAVLHLDSNLNQLLAAWLTFLETRLDAPSVWSFAGLPSRGSRGKRLIDTAHVVNLQVDTARVIGRKRPPKVDHRPIVYAAHYAPNAGH